MEQEMEMEMTRDELNKMKKNALIEAWTNLVEYMWDTEKDHWKEEGRPNDHIFVSLRTLNRFLNDEDDSDSDDEDEDPSDDEDEPEHDKRIEEIELDRKKQQLIDLIIKTNEENDRKEREEIESDRKGKRLDFEMMD